jgi:putative transposase
MPCHRKVDYQLYPNQVADLELGRTADVCRQVYNWGLEQRKAHYEATKKTLSFAAQCRALTVERKLRPAWQSVHTHALQLTLKRLDLAFSAFFRRLKAGDKPGFPRFKSLRRFGGFGFKEYGNGWKLKTEMNRRKGGTVTPEPRWATITGIGRLRLRGLARIPGGVPKTCEVVQRAGKWFLSVTYAYAKLPARKRTGELISGLDWGVRTFAVFANHDGTDGRIANPRHLRKQLKTLAAAQRTVSRGESGSKRHYKAKLAVARLHAKVANERKNFLHQTSASIIRQRKVLAIEKLSVLAMTSTEGTTQSGLNREILAAAPGLFHHMLRYKAEEAGCALIEVDPRLHKPSQTCSGGGPTRKKSLNERWHVLPDGTVIDRDLNSARNLLNVALAREPGQHSGPKTASDTGCETPPIAA